MSSTTTENKTTTRKSKASKQAQMEVMKDENTPAQNPQGLEQQEQPQGIMPSENDIKILQQFYQNEQKLSATSKELNDKRYSFQILLNEAISELDKNAKDSIENKKSFANLIDKYKEIYERENECSGLEFKGFNEQGEFVFA